MIFFSYLSYFHHTNITKVSLKSHQIKKGFVMAMKDICNSKSFVAGKRLAVTPGKLLLFLLAGAAGFMLQVADAPAAENPQEAFKSLFGQQLREVTATRSLQDDVKLAGEMVQTARSSELSDELLIVMYDAAFDLASKSPDGYPKALEAMDCLAKAVPAREIKCSQRSLELILKRLQQAKTLSQRQDNARPYVEALMKTADLLAETGNLDSAVVYSRKAMMVSTSLKLPNALEIRERNSRLLRMQNTEKRRAMLDKKVKADPSDNASRKKLIELHLVDLDDPAGASKLLNADCDEMLRTYVALAVKPVDQVEPSGLDELARWYSQLADGAVGGTSKGAMLRRSEGYYVRFLDVYTDKDTKRIKASLELASVRKKLLDIEKSSRGPETKHPVLISGLWPCSTAGLVFVWRDSAWMKSVRGTVGVIARAGKLTARGKARITETFAMNPSGGAFVADSAINDRLLSECGKSNEFTVEAMIRPDRVPQYGPVRIISFSRDAPDCNFIVAQKQSELVFSVATSSSDRSRFEPLFELSGDKWHHVVLVYRLEKDDSSGETTGKFTSYLNGRETASGKCGEGLLSVWKPMSLLFGDEYVEKREDRRGSRDPRDWRWWSSDWRGRLKGVAIYSRAISLKEVAVKYKAMRAVIVQQEQSTKRTPPDRPKRRIPEKWGKWRKSGRGRGDHRKHKP